MTTLFTRIIKGEVPAYKVYEDLNYLAFLDIRPINAGHTLVVPKESIDYIFDHKDSTLTGLILVAKKVAKAIDKVTPQERIGLMVAGLEVPHTHIHLVPISVVADLKFANAKEVGLEDLACMQKKIQKAM